MNRRFAVLGILLTPAARGGDKERPWTETEETLGSIVTWVMSALNS